MQKASNQPIIYDFFSKSLKDITFSRAQQTADHNFKGIPATVVSVEDYEKYQCVSVRALINDVFVERDNLVLESIILKKVFVALPRSGDFLIKQPVKVGDIVRLCWSHRDLGAFLDSDGSAVDVKVSEVAQIEDCWVELGFGTRKNHNKPSLTDFIIQGKNTEIVIKPSGDITVNTNGTSYIKSTHHTVDTNMTITGNLLVNGNTNIDQNLTVTGTSTLQSMVTASSGVSAASYAGIGGGNNVMLGTVTIGGKVVNTHYHLYDGDTPTSPMQ